MRHPWEGTIHQHTAIWADHRRRTARPVRDCAAIASLVAPCHSGEIQVRTARDCNHHQSCDPQHAMSSAEAAQAMSKEIQLSLGPDAGPKPESHGHDIDQPSRTPLTAPRKGEPVQNRSQTWQDRNGVWHNWRTSETASESASTRTRNAQQTWNQKGQDWQRDRPSSSQDWRHDWQWEGDRDRTLKGFFCIEYSLWEPAGGPRR